MVLLADARTVLSHQAVMCNAGYRGWIGEWMSVLCGTCGLTVLELWGWMWVFFSRQGELLPALRLYE